jgi:predicted HD superfamily hydrolase involved in NAD metabolism
MHPILEVLTRNNHFTRNITLDMVALQQAHGHPNVAEHCLRVSAEAVRLARRFGADPEKARIAGLLHDISDIIPLDQAVHAAREFGIAIFPEEESCPAILHQRLSVTVAREVFHVDDAEVLGAIECHTTLKPHPTLLEKILFIADKIEWDQPRENPHLKGVLEYIHKSLDSAVYYFVDRLWQERESLMVLHPWLQDAYEDLMNATSKAS